MSTSGRINSLFRNYLRSSGAFHKVGENDKTRGYIVTPRTPELLQQHKREVDGKVMTRFSPEPNGFLHIGHAKAININFGLAEAMGGKCTLRFDDTNPEHEDPKYMNSILETIRWLGFEPHKVTYASDYFDKLYKWAVELIHKDLAYVCHQSAEETAINHYSSSHFNVKPSPWRDRRTEESLELFQDMKNGKIKMGEATLRLKTTLVGGKADPIAYRIKNVPHHRTRDKLRIYPTYDFTHCLCDSLENITHSLCTNEFQARRSSYYWLCNMLDIYCPVQMEFARLNMWYTVLSKRKILKMIECGIVNDWDDPRLFTLPALRRRGIPPEAINEFVARLGLSVEQTPIDPSVFDGDVRQCLNANAPRTMAVLDPLKVTIENYNELGFDDAHTVTLPCFPADSNSTDLSSQDSFEADFAKSIYIERSDFKEVAEKGYRRLTKTQPVGLKHTGRVVLHFKSAVMSPEGDLLELVVNAEKLSDSKKKRPKAFIHWVANPSICEVRLYDRLFNHKNPEDPDVVSAGFLTDYNANSITVLPNALIDKSISIVSKKYNCLQFERTGYFCVDKDSREDKMVFNQVIPLKEDSAKRDDE